MTEVDDALAGYPQPQQDTLRVVRQRLRVLLPDADEVIAYGVPAFKVDGVGIAGYSASKKHCSYLPMSGSVLSAIAEALDGYSWSKGALRFPIDQPLSVEMLELLVSTRQAEIAAGTK